MSLFLAVILAIVVHVFLILRAFPLLLLFNGEIPLIGDISRYFGNANAFSHIKGVFGYDPYFMAGYPAGLWNSMGKKGFEIMHSVFSFLPLPALFYAVVVTLSFLGPLLVWMAARAFCPNRRASICLFFICLVYWHLDTQIAYFWNFGNIFYPVTSCFLPMSVVCMLNILNKRKVLLSILGVAAFSCAVFYFHTVLLLPVFVCLVACLALNIKSLKDWRIWAAFAVSFGLFFIAASFWLLPLLDSRLDYQPLFYSGFQGTFKHLIMDLFSDRVYAHMFDRNFLFHLAVVFGFAGAWLYRNDEKAKPIVAMALGAAGCIVAAYSSSYFGFMRSFQPYRLLAPATILLLGGVALFVNFAIENIRKSAKPVRIIVAVIIIASAPGFTAYIIDLAGSKPSAGLSSEQRSALEDIKRLPMRGRLLSDDISLGHLVPYYCKIPVIGGLSAEAFLKHRYAGFDYDGRLFGRLPKDWAVADLARYLEVYAADFAIFKSAEWIGFARRNTDLFIYTGPSSGNYQIFKIKDTGNPFILNGSARVSADYDLIDVRDNESRELVLKFHYEKFLGVNEGVRLEPIFVLDDPVPFIRAIVPENVKQFQIRKSK